MPRRSPMCTPGWVTRVARSSPGVRAATRRARSGAVPPHAFSRHPSPEVPMRRRSSLALLAALVLVVVPAIAAPVGAAGDDRRRTGPNPRLLDAGPAALRRFRATSFARIADSRRRRGRSSRRRRPEAVGVAASPARPGRRKARSSSASGKVYFVMGSSAYVCSGSVVNDHRTARSLVLTAGHCTYDEANHRFGHQLDVRPRVRRSNLTLGELRRRTTYGCWTADRRSSSTTDSPTPAASTSRRPSTTSRSRSSAGGGFTGSAQLDSTVGSFPITYIRASAPARSSTRSATRPPASTTATT